jgi:hypothetical protein
MVSQFEARVANLLRGELITYPQRNQQLPLPQVIHITQSGYTQVSYANFVLQNYGETQNMWCFSLDWNTAQFIE